MIHYRKLDRAGTNVPQQSTLESAIRVAMGTQSGGVALRNRYLERTQSVGGDHYFINTYAESSEDGTPLTFGDILHFTKGHLQALCQTADQNAAMVPVQQMRAPEQSEYVHSQMFWMVKGDHAFIIQSLSLKTEALEAYLGWLLKTKTQALPANAEIVLSAKFDEELIGGDLNDIQELIIGGVASPPAPGGLEQEAEPEERVRDVVQAHQVDAGRTAGWPQAREILKALLGGDGNVDQLMAGVPADAELNVQVHIGYRTKRRRVDRASLKQLERGLRNLPDGQLQVKAKGLKKGADGSVRLHHPASVMLLKVRDGNNQVIGSLLDPADVRRAMFEAYTVLSNNGKIA